ncbi:hypothetical protein IX317_001650 [Fusobacterium sp. DD29]|uniref:hypothetical protein n=1 Tax=unclassified Fusobacterium TaxID=2648384 RepID=UPI001B8C1BEE|nr:MULTISPECIES: hypothetical protein [unclassified Fusobacterium]MBR8749970.1 hypothetical protein [Fusobacterium sp. DD29]MBR8762217.1 hypothetical protein [Fusobacterium sp. DD25]MBR8768229.1 hypothetical protein [Fusobacterium sp. DD43]MBR8772305.1 hypothetical protein [Fusobacterium sp. DD40]MBR8776524.1 hypothetical protein [Fusobacterium sp. DD17]
MKGKKFIKAVNFNCVFGENNEPMLKEFNRIVFPAFKNGRQEKSRSIVKKLMFHEVKIFKSELGYCLYGKIIKDISLIIENQLDSKGNLIQVNKEVDSAPYSEFILILVNHKMLYIPSQPGSPTLSDFKSLIKHSMKNIIKVNDIREDKKLLKFELDIFEIPEEITLKNKLKSVEVVDYFKFQIKAQNSILFDDKYIANLENERKELGAKNIEQKIDKPTNLEKIKQTILTLKDMACYTLRAKFKDKEWETIKNSTYVKIIEYYFDESNSDNENIKEAVNQVAKAEKRLSEIDEHNKIVYNETEEQIKKLCK